MEQNHWQLGTWGRIPVSMHWTVLIAFVWLYLFFWDLLATAIAAVAFFSLLVVHEFGHVAVLRWRKIPVESIELNGIHGRTSHGLASAADEILVAWGGVGAQLLVLLLALATSYALEAHTNAVVSIIASPLLFVLTKLNILLMVVALLPLGPFDGHRAWAVIAWLRRSVRRRRQIRQSSTKAAAELMDKLSKKAPDRKEDA